MHPSRQSFLLREKTTSTASESPLPCMWRKCFDGKAFLLVGYHSPPGPTCQDGFHILPSLLNLGWSSHPRPIQIVEEAHMSLSAVILPNRPPYPKHSSLPPSSSIQPDFHLQVQTLSSRPLTPPQAKREQQRTGQATSPPDEADTPCTPPACPSPPVPPP